MTEMMNSDEWITHVLGKLRRRLLNGQAIVGEVWEYDSNESSPKEDNAIQFLTGVGVIGSTITGITSSGEMYESEVYRNIHIEHEDWIRIISMFSPEKYAEMCAIYGLDPYKEQYRAELKLVNEVTPVITVGTTRVELPTLHAGKATDIIRYCYRKAGTPVARKELQQIGVNPLPNIRNVIRTSYFAHGDGILAPFMDVSPESATLHPSATLSQQQLDAIQQAT